MQYRKPRVNPEATWIIQNPADKYRSRSYKCNVRVLAQYLFSNNMDHLGKSKQVETGAFIYINQLFLSPLVCSTVRVGCCAGAVAMSAEKTESHEKNKATVDALMQTKLKTFTFCNNKSRKIKGRSRQLQEYEASLFY